MTNRPSCCCVSFRDHRDRCCEKRVGFDEAACGCCHFFLLRLLLLGPDGGLAIAIAIAASVPVQLVGRISPWLRWGSDGMRPSIG